MDRHDVLDVLSTTLCAFLVLVMPQIASGSPRATAKTSVGRPNILFCISDDQCWLHTGAAGDKVVQTPNFDRIAREGVRFTHAFTAAPSCTPSRGAILTGRNIWQLEEGGVLYSTLPAKFKTYPDILEQAGYFVGFTGKGWAPGNFKAAGRTRNPAGTSYNKRFDKNRPTSRIHSANYAANFEDFLNHRPAGQPFCFWYGASEPHRPYEEGSGLRAGKHLQDVSVPPFLPDTSDVRGDILDYYVEIEWFDKHLGRMIRRLEQTGELDNTIIVVTSDNGMPFPRAKATLYDYGVRMPLAIRWGNKVAGGRVVNDLVSLTDIAPTFLEAAGLQPPTQTTGRSLLDILCSGKSGRVDPNRDCVFTALERHAWSRPDGATYPIRAIRTERWLFIRNYEPDRWPAGPPDFEAPHNAIYGDIDSSPSKTYLMQHKTDANVAELFQRGFGKRPAEELYDVNQDPCQLNNLAEDATVAVVAGKLRARLEQYLRDTNDPRLAGESPWDGYPFYWKDYWKRAKKRSPG